MLMNAKGEDVTKAVTKLQRNNPKVYAKNRENILVHLREVLVPSHKEHTAGMFSLEQRAVMK